MMSLKNCIFQGTYLAGQKNQFYFLRKSFCLTASYSLRGLSRKILGTCFLDFLGMFGIVCQMPAASGDAKRQSE